MFRVGNGYDVHKLISGRKLILGGVHIPYHLGLDGHSDADVLIHTIMDALLGAMGARDIGFYFPDNNNEFKDISSMVLLEKVKGILKEKNYKISNIDSILVAQMPKISPYIETIKENIACTLDIDIDCVGVKATTTEGLGPIGQGQGISSYAVACIYKYVEGVNHEII